MIRFLVIHTRYTDVQIGLYANAQAIDIITIDSKKLSKLFPQHIDELLKKHALTLSDLTCIVAHQGPAPFTTLRVSLSITNALHYALHIPLVGVDGLNALLDEFQAPTCTVVALLNAFGKDVYYGIAPACASRYYGCQQADQLMAQLARDFADEPIYLIGNGVDLVRGSLNTYVKAQAIIPESHPELASIDTIAKHGLMQWQKRDILTEIQPLYLKDYQPHVGPAR